MTRSTPLAVPTNLPFLCGLGMHKVVGLPRWNDGFYFTTCARCGRDLVRTAFEKWTVPDGFRVVWRPDAPQRSPSARLVEDHHDTSAAQVEFPIRVSAQEAVDRADDTAEDAEESYFPEEERDTASAFAFAGEVEEAPKASAAARGEPELAEAEGAPIHDLLRTLWNREPSDDQPNAEREDDPAADEPDQESVAPEHDAFAPEQESLEPQLEAEALASEQEALAQEQEEATLAEDLDSDAATQEPEAEAADESSPEPELELEPEPEPSRPRYLVIPDFMDEKPLSLPYDKATGQITAVLTPTGEPADIERDDPQSVLSPGWKDLVRGKAESAGVAGNRLLRQMRSERGPRVVRVSRTPGPAREGSGGVGDFFAGQGGAIVAAAVFGGLVLLAAVVDGRNRPAPEAYQPVSTVRSPSTQAAAPARAAGRTKARGATGAPRSDLAFVTASLLNCRAIPADNGETVRRLARGDSVQVLGADPGWLSVSHQGRQCWASARWISTERPL